MLQWHCNVVQRGYANQGLLPPLVHTGTKLVKSCFLGKNGNTLHKPDTGHHWCLTHAFIRAVICIIHSGNARANTISWFKCRDVKNLVAFLLAKPVEV